MQEFKPVKNERLLENLQDCERCVRTLRTQKLSIKIDPLPLGINYDSALIMHAMSEYN